MSEARARACALGLVLALFAPHARAAEFDRGDWKLDLGGSVRELVVDTREPRTEDLFPGAGKPLDFGVSPSLLASTRVRLELEARWRERFSAELVWDHELFLGSGRDALSFDLGQELGFRTWIDLDHVIVDSGDLTWQQLLYRGWVRYEGQDFEATLGRQRIALGRGRLWNPTDLFNPIPPLAIEGGQRIGVDSLVARARLAGELWGVLIVAPQDRDDRYKSALRLELSVRELDAALLAARIETDSVLGGDFALNVGDAALRGEATWTFHEHGGHTTQLVASLDYTFALGTGVYGLVEHFYNGNLLPRGSIRDLVGALPPLDDDVGLALLTGSGLIPEAQLVTRSRNQTGFQLGYDLTPLLRFDVLWLHDWEGPSEAIVPSLSWSPRSDLELSAGVQLFGGYDGEGDYGGRDPLYYVRAELFF